MYTLDSTKSALRRRGFRLTGSRFFGNHKPGSDWDYFGESCIRNIGFLADWGFLCVGSKYGGYLSSSESAQDIESVWVHRVHPIHVQLVRNPQLKKQIQRILASKFLPLMRTLPKYQRAEMWEGMYSLHRSNNLNFGGYSHEMFHDDDYLRW